MFRNLSVESNAIPETEFATSNISNRPVEQAPSIPVQNNRQKDEDPTPILLFRQSGHISVSSLSIHDLLPTPKITRNPTKIRRSLKEKATLVTQCLFPTDRKTLSSVSNEVNLSLHGKETRVNSKKSGMHYSDWSSSTVVLWQKEHR
jgi:hypothetical protein